jgi:dipeptidyl aminopeptidase/acylaminoacyl peptidase
VEKVVSLATPLADADAVFWTEMRPAEGGRQVVVRRGTGPTAREEDVFGADFHARSLVHEYGGLPYAVRGGTVFFVNYVDQRIYRVDPGAAPVPLTPAPRAERSVRYAAPVVTADGRALYAVRERHAEPDVPADVVNDIVVVATDGSATPRVVAEGHDFFSHVTLSPDDGRVAWTCWDHPNMPWDGTELWEGQRTTDGLVHHPRRVAGGPGESVTQPAYSPRGVLHYVSDRSGWWNIYAVDGPDAGGQPVAPMEVDLGTPDWVFGMSSYAFCSDGAVVAAWSERGLDRLGVLRPGSSVFEEIPTGYTSFGFLHPDRGGRSVLATAGGPTEPTSVVRITPPSEGTPGNASLEVLRRSRSSAVEASHLSVPEPIEFPTEGGLTAHALYYPPHNPDWAAPPGELPPLIVASHGGPTSAATAVLNYAVQFWTSRGIGVVDVNYGGSTGYGRSYRRRLNGNWGVVDLDDCVNAALFLAESGRADRSRLLIHGGSAGGYTTLCAITFRDDFAAGASYFGVADAGALARETHKFEARYLDTMIGPWPEAAETYRQRSPLFHTEQIRTPVILFQGLEDKVVPPDQAETMVASLRERGVPFAYIAFEGEQHGFRRAENVRRTTEAELYFYGRVLGFTPADRLEPVTIENEDRLTR